MFKTPNTIVHTLLLGTVFTFLYSAYVILFGLKLRKWDNNAPGLCYDTKGISTPDSRHPDLDYVYLALTSFYLLGSLLLCLKPARESLLSRLRQAGVTERQGPRVLRLVYALIYAFGTAVPVCGLSGLSGLWSLGPKYSRQYEKMMQKIKSRIYLLGERLPKWHVVLQFASRVRNYINFYGGHVEAGASLSVLSLAIVQYPVHGYMLFALRHSNEAYLSGDSESSWGFGQVVALVLVAATIMDCVRSIISKCCTAGD